MCVVRVLSGLLLAECVLGGWVGSVLGAITAVSLARYHPSSSRGTVELRGVPMAAATIKVASRFNLVLQAGKATPQPPVGSALGQRGLNLMNFCKAFNDQTAKFKDVPIRVCAAHSPTASPSPRAANGAGGRR